MNARPIRFFHRGAVVEISGAAPTRTVLEWLREDARCTGTTEGCAEGDCGACTVVVGELAAAGGVNLQPVNACIRFLPTLDGKALFTVEDVAAPDGTLHPVQRAMVDCHGSQCGFCTPGFVMSLWAGFQRHQAAGTVPTRQQLADDLSGNLCRCTGYRPILDAGQRAFEQPAPMLDRVALGAALRALQQDTPLHYAPGKGAPAFHAPRTLAEFAALREARPQARVLAGSTDMGLWVTKQFKDLGELIHIGDVAELKRVDVQPQRIVIGAAASLEAAWQALVAEWPTLRDVWLRFAALPLRVAGTMGGNVANGSPIGDSAPVLMALGAAVVLRRGERVRSMPLEDFYVGYMQNHLEPGEFLQAIEVPRRCARQQAVRAYKISKRFDCDISAVCAAFAIELEGERIASVRLAYGGMAATVKRATQAETALLGQPWTEASLQSATAALARAYTPLTDMRASAGYRAQVAQNLLRRFWLETRPVDPLPESAVNVWAREVLA
ncbi:MAG TPA: xanthine dehydrogenase small subunit [Rubrivivax sp.]|nr:xanthine dehydrogenase small subunit [Rubrivivax sp.]